MKTPARMPASVRITSAYLSDKHFMMTMGVAFFLHLLALSIWIALPHERTLDIPVRVLNIKLGEADESEAASPAPPQPVHNNTAVEQTLSRTMEAKTAALPKPEPQAVKMPDKVKEPKELVAKQEILKPQPAKETPTVSALEQNARQFVRERDQAPASAGTTNGSVMGNSDASNAEILRRYEQMLSSWIQKTQIYPEAARSQKMEGTGMVRIRIDRRGTVRYWAIERRTGSQLLDRAMLDTQARANPFPAVPADYPRKDELLEFLVPITFKLQ